ncbi:alpha/beta hydrolase fold domain-containing protein [Brachybacterium sp. EF45031]|nr:alpha/beta hydrolase fold domain-containing protein [Brachybacterium sillae]
MAQWARRTHRPSTPSRRLVPAAQVTRERLGGTPVTWIRRDLAGAGALIHLHGGSYVHGENATTWDWLAEVQRRTGAAAAMVHYRMPPAHPYPYALDDTLDALQAMVRETTVREGRWVLSGDSAGAGLALATAVALRDGGLELPRALVLTSPWVDLTGTDPLRPVQQEREPAMLAQNLQRAARVYAGSLDESDPRVSPLFADLRGLPPVHLLAGDRDLLLGDSRRLRDALVAAGVDVEYVEVPGGVHNHPFLPGGASVQYARRAQIEAVRGHLGLCEAPLTFPLPGGAEGH